MNECKICRTTLRSDNRSGICQRTPACRAERYRRELERTGTGPRCLCAHRSGRHGLDGAGSCRCGCRGFRQASGPVTEPTYAFDLAAIAATEATG